MAVVRNRVDTWSMVNINTDMTELSKWYVTCLGKMCMTIKCKGKTVFKVFEAVGIDDYCAFVTIQIK